MKKILFLSIILLSFLFELKAQSGYLVIYDCAHQDTLFRDDGSIEIQYNYPNKLIYKVADKKAVEIWERESGENNLHIYDFDKGVVYVESPRIKNYIRTLSPKTKTKTEVVFLNTEQVNGLECHRYKVVLSKIEVYCWVWKDAPTSLPSFTLTGEIDLCRIEELNGLLVKVEFTNEEGLWEKYHLKSFNKETFSKEIFEIPKL